MKKRLCAILLTAAILLTLLPQTLLFASAEGETSGSCGENLAWSFDEATGTLTITGSGAMDDWGWSSDVPWYSYCDAITSVILPDGLTSIGNRAFYYCTGLTAISIPDSVRSIGDEAFYGCTGLTSITIGNGVRSIGYDAFFYCTGLTSITVAEGNSFYDSRNNCNAIIETATNALIAGCKNTVIPSGVTSIDMSAFAGCTGLTAISIPDSVTSISDYAFDGCTGLTAISIPDSVTSIGWDAFYGCTGLTNITIPDSVTRISWYAFAYCTGLTSITVAEDNSFYDSRNNCNAIIETATNTLIAGCKSTVIPSGVTAIFDNAFYGCTELTAISIPDSVRSIGDEAFYGCTGLTAISIPDSVTSIGSRAFEGCTGLTSVTIGNGVTSIGRYAFYNCTELTSVTIGNGVTSIGRGMFSECTGLTSITIPSGVTSIGWYAFSGCTGLTDVYYPGTEEEWNAIDIDDGNDPLANATIHFGQTEADPCEGYTDINRSSWYHSAADFVITRGLMGSTKTDRLTFEPMTACTRSMIATMLYSLEGKPEVTYEAVFPDVKDGQWYTAPIMWAYQNGVVTGYSNGSFGPNDKVTREQMAVILKAYTEKVKGLDTSKAADLSGFADANKVTWSKSFISWAVAEGLLSGKANGGKLYLDPQGNATRAEVAAIMMSFITKIVE